MSLTHQDEQTLSALFRKQKVLNPLSPEYLQNKESIIKFVWRKLTPKMEAYRQIWQRRYNLDDSDCQSLMAECLLAAVDRYDISRGHCKFTSFFWTTVSRLFKNHLSYLYARKRTPKAVFSGDKTLRNRGAIDTETTLFDTIGEHTQTFEEILNAKLLVMRIFQNATTKQQHVLVRLLLGEKYHEISNKLNISPSTITNLLKQLRKQYLNFRNEV